MPSAGIRLFVYFCFFLSGAAGLIYEVVWSKYLVLIFGNTTYSYTLILATFMGGLALGSFLIGRAADSIKDKLRLYAALEIGIAFFCAFTPALFHLSKHFYVPLAGVLNLDVAGLTGLKFLAGAVIMLPPTIMMGGTLPLLCAYMVDNFPTRGQTVARLYYVNSLGAAGGTLLSGFYLIAHYGFAVSIQVAVSINYFVGLSVLVFGFLSKKYRKTGTMLPDGNLPFGESARFPEGTVRIAYAGIVLSGAAAMLYELVWTRLLSIIFGSSTYSFSLMLAAFIFGIALGSFLMSRFMPEGRFVLFLLGVCQLLIGASLIAVLPFYERLPSLFVWLVNSIPRVPEKFLFYQFIKFALAFLVMLPPTVFLGMTFPLVSRIASGRQESLGRNVGRAYGFNTLGNILGTLATGLILIPLLGLKNTLELGVALSLLVGIVLLSVDRAFNYKVRFACITACSLVFLGYMYYSSDWDKKVFTGEVFRVRGLTQLESAKKHSRILYYKDGLNATVSVASWKDLHLNLMINGKTDASSYGDLSTQIFLSQIPLILKPEAHRVLVIGLGSGITAGSALLHPIEELDVVEISHAVVEASGFFAAHNNNALDDPRLRLHLEDARTYLQRTDRKYDVIISEPSNPWAAGNGSLFSSEFFEDCQKRLKDDGYFAQWVQTYEIDEEIFKVILRTFASVFPEVSMWDLKGPEVLLIGSKRKLSLDREKSQQRLSHDPILLDLKRTGIDRDFSRLESILSLQLASSDTIKGYVGAEGPVNSDYFPVLEYRTPLTLFIDAAAGDTVDELARRESLGPKGSLLPR